MQRPYFSSSIVALEAEFEKQRHDPAFLIILREELSHRTTYRARQLQRRIAEALHETKRSASNSPSENDSSPNLDQRSVSLRESISQPESVILRPEKQVHISSELQNTPQDILAAWIGLEVLSPATFRRPEDLASNRDRRCVASLDCERLPWEGHGEKSRPNFQLFYHVMLGSIDLDRATALLLQKYSDSRVERPAARGDAVIAVITLDRKGKPVGPPSTSVSSFAWGVPVAFQEDLSSLAQWPDKELRLQESLDGVIRHVDAEGELLPLTREDIGAAYHWAIQALHLPENLVKPPSFMIRAYQYYRNSEPPEILLNSFFLRDLATARQSFANGTASKNLRNYLGLDAPAERRDLLKDNIAIEDAVAPNRIPPARWPNPGRVPLVLLQQAAVNLSLDSAKPGIVAVNGPPGTGKTTLLRDLVAALTTARAEIMATLEDPESAFTHSGERIRAGAGWLHLYRLDPRLKGFEMLIASSNNKAVENVSAELPAIGAVSADINGLRYFKTISDQLLERETWGLVAAILGNAANRSHFKQTFWWDEDVGMMTYFAEAAGTPQLIPIKDEDGKVVGNRQPKIVAQEDPPCGHQDALKRWNQARSDFQKALRKGRDALRELERIRHFVCRLPAVEQGEAAVRQAGVLLAQHQERRSFWLARLLPTTRNRLWRRENKRLRLILQEVKLKHAEAYDACFKRDSLAPGSGLQEVIIESDNYKNSVRNARHEVDAARLHLGLHLIDASFFERDHAERQRSSPWCEPVVQFVRDELFVQAIKLHKAFVDAAAKPLKHNVGTLMGSFAGPNLAGDKAKLLSDLWSSFFLVVPLVSTTFASIERMVGELPAESLGWLFIDEAGQALPQAAVGAIMRARRVVAVGDPVQLEPIVTLPEGLTQQICRAFAVDPDRFNAPTASVQTLADSATPYFADFEGKRGCRTVGIPLLMHRRCSEPMFSISNSVAYEHLMVNAKPVTISKIRNLLGPSRWIDVEGSGFDKWSAAEGNEVLELLKGLASADFVPDLYIITPFVVVADNVRRLLLSSRVLERWTEDPETWVYERVGTVHTVQGREAEAVIFVLGAPDPHQSGARNWAGGRPNLLNVAVTRAKEVLYVVGNRGLWRDAGFFRELHAYMS
jgi:hypothetical protein